MANGEPRIAIGDWRLAGTCIAIGEWRMAGTNIAGFFTPSRLVCPREEVPDAGTLQPAATARFRAMRPPGCER